MCGFDPYDMPITDGYPALKSFAAIIVIWLIGSSPLERRPDNLTPAR